MGFWSNKQQEKYCVSKAKIFTSGDIELNPGAVNAYMLLQSRLAQHALSILRVLVVQGTAFSE